MKPKEIGIWVGVIVILIIGLWALIGAVNNSPSPQTPSKIENLSPVSQSDFVKGDGKAKVILIEYADFQCPACRSYFPLAKQLSSEFSKDLKVVYRFFPLTTIHQNALISAQAAYAAGLQGKFWEMHDKLFENQSSWSGLSNPKDIFVDYAKKLNLNIDKFKKDLEADSTKEFINKAADNATAIGINSTPTFFVNGKHIQNPTGYDEFKKIIQDDINK